MTRQPPMTSIQREAVLTRDGGCVIVVADLDRSHQCRDQWGEPHSPYELSRLTIEHVKPEAGMSIRAPHDWTVAMCGHANAVEHWGSANRELLRAYLAGVRAAERRAA